MIITHAKTDAAIITELRRQNADLRNEIGQLARKAEGQFQCSYCGTWHYGSNRTYCDLCAAHPHHRS